MESLPGRLSMQWLNRTPALLPSEAALAGPAPKTMLEQHEYHGDRPERYHHIADRRAGWHEGGDHLAGSAFRTAELQSAPLRREVAPDFDAPCRRSSGLAKGVKLLLDTPAFIWWGSPLHRSRMTKGPIGRNAESGPLPRPTELVGSRSRHLVIFRTFRS